ncbi:MULTISPECIES: ABC transporter ATP-binding protein [Rhodopseudomonas]|uniref:ABC transporter ATP-binding protein n=1 Tax=Rhodopseudomonas palustris TaxID=1076 RepID=A0A0D7EA05_RHOPL|nr:MULTISPECIES: ABC transporter ATP-binding protein [Rhodopseudomonas]KIZ37466.1 ABC transporter ATP-binding protein [Rhodopseudomonas palustris]MDF3809330.1 ABC transporter ATP-binding protein [Rhodopseudomonas sp. BAL398]WOK16995.1 ABC transporter ATP-binding protein [Rhodopseudomonas sp. BAL398]
MSAAISVMHVEKNFRAVRALRDVSFELAPGRLSALVGHNGAGKTTLIKLMLGLIRPTHGEVRSLGQDPAAGEFSARRWLGYLPESVAFNSALTGRETLSFYARLKQISPAAGDSLFERVGLSNAADRRVGTYSKGMRQRLGLAQALLGQPRVLLLDEPTTGLDPALRQTFYEILGELRDAGATVLISSHALDELEGRAEHVLIMNQGHLVAQGTMAELRTISQLPIRVTVDLDGENAAPPAWLTDGFRPGERRQTVLAADDRAKMQLLRAAANDPRVGNIEVAAPTLDDLYAHFLRAGARAS